MLSGSSECLGLLQSITGRRSVWWGGLQASLVLLLFEFWTAVLDVLYITRNISFLFDFRSINIDNPRQLKYSIQSSDEILVIVLPLRSISLGPLCGPLFAFTWGQTVLFWLFNSVGLCSHTYTLFFKKNTWINQRCLYHSSTMSYVKETMSLSIL
jgi:hypothetical protein